MTDARAERALTDVVAVERIAPGLIKVVTWSDAYPVDARDAGCNCPDKQYHAAAVCKHEHAALLADTDLPAPFVVADNLSERVATDGGKSKTDSEYHRHDLELRDVADRGDARCPDDMAGCLVVSYNAVSRNRTYSESRHVSSRLPMACLTLFDGGTVDVTDLSPADREWIQSESALYSNEIDFSGTEMKPGVNA